jgi:hypothetical protein
LIDTWVFCFLASLHSFSHCFLVFIVMVKKLSVTLIINRLLGKIYSLVASMTLSSLTFYIFMCLGINFSFFTLLKLVLPKWENSYISSTLENSQPLPHPILFFTTPFIFLIFWSLILSLILSLSLFLSMFVS